MKLEHNSISFPSPLNIIGVKGNFLYIHVLLMIYNNFIKIG